MLVKFQFQKSHLKAAISFWPFLIFYSTLTNNLNFQLVITKLENLDNTYDGSTEEVILGKEALEATLQSGGILDAAT